MYIALDNAGAHWLVWGALRPGAQPARAANLSRFYGSKTIFLAVDVLALAVAAAWLLVPNQQPSTGYPMIIALLNFFGAQALRFRKAPTFVAGAVQALNAPIKTHFLINGAMTLCVVAKIAMVGASLFA